MLPIFMFRTTHVEVWYTVGNFLVPGFDQARCLDIANDSDYDGNHPSERGVDLHLMAAIAAAERRPKPDETALSSRDWRLGPGGRTLVLGDMEIKPCEEGRYEYLFRLAMPEALEARVRGDSFDLPLHLAIMEAERIHSENV